MSDSHSPARASAPFTPRAFVPVTVGRTALSCHRSRHATSRTSVCIPHQRYSSIFPESIDLRAQLDALGHQLNLSAMVDGVIQDWLRHFQDRWSDFSRLSILSFHNTRGKQAFDTTDAANTAILLPVVGGAITDCRKNVKFVHMQLSISFWIL